MLLILHSKTYKKILVILTWNFWTGVCVCVCNGVLEVALAFNIFRHFDR